MLLSPGGRSEEKFPSGSAVRIYVMKAGVPFMFGEGHGFQQPSGIFKIPLRPSSALPRY